MKPLPDKDEIIRLYIDENLSSTDVCSLMKISRRQFYKLLKIYGIKKSVDKIIEQKKNVYLEKYGVDNPSKSECIKEKIKQTNIKKYGVDNPSKSECIKEKIKQTCLEKYGVDNVAKNNEIKSKMVETNITRYGYKSPTQNKIIRQKSIETCRKNNGVDYPIQNDVIKQTRIYNNNVKYGIDYPIQLDEVKEKIKQTNILNHGVEFVSQKNISKESLEIIHNKDKLINFFNEHNTKSRKYIASLLKVSKELIDRCLHDYGLSDDYKLSGTSSYEEEIVAYIKTFYDGNVLRNQRILDGKEIDIYLPDIHLGIEFNGDYWHSEEMLLKKGYNPETYHENKTNIAKERGIFLYHIFEYEYNNNEQFALDTIKSLIMERVIV